MPTTFYGSCDSGGRAGRVSVRGLIPQPGVVGQDTQPRVAPNATIGVSTNARQSAWV